MRERFTSRGAKVVELALREALRAGDRHISPEHIRRALAREEQENAGAPDVLPEFEPGGVVIHTGLVEA